ncbi:hypothetical protein OOU_Y34scaffold01193g2 [Pyricularia oryzae Y34]|uniref:Cytochrome P450 n=1 Tax=Pyricularia oryzae (strain Y34) TaxID=1143189 RepID=A0AA97NLG1_PYRO3|nr:hypothetical protein OOU_Y34scaffold01193g2 [Pyricularia oryzae Y34]
MTVQLHPWHQPDRAQNEHAFRVQTDHSEVIILAPKYATEIRDGKGLSAGSYTEIVSHQFRVCQLPQSLTVAAQELMGNLPGMEAFSFAGTHRELMHDVITRHLNRALPSMLSGIAEEASECLNSLWGKSSEWKTIPLYESMLSTISQVSIRVFLGPEMSRNKRWVQVNLQYTVVGLGAVSALRRWPRFLLPIIHHFHPQMRATRALIKEAKEILRPVVESRKSKRDGSSNSLDWFQEVAAQRGERYNPEVAQLTFSVAAMHSTSDHLTQVLFDLARHQDAVHALRREMVKVIGDEGWTITALNNLKLMDSVLKESQRLKPVNQVLKDIYLSNGVCLPKGSFVAVSCSRMRDPAVYPDPDEFKPDRFVKLASSDSETARYSGFSAVSIDHTGFGFGKHACPGRIYVTLELKIILCHILLLYDIKVPEGFVPNLMIHGFDSLTDLTASMHIKRREPEIHLPEYQPLLT